MTAALSERAEAQGQAGGAHGYAQLVLLIKRGGLRWTGKSSCSPGLLDNVA